MSTTTAKKITRHYGRILKQAHYPVKAIYLFGSQAKGQAHRWSDIDVAVISNRTRTNDDDRLALWQLRRAVDLRIEPYSFTQRDFGDHTNPLVNEILKTGIRIL